MLIALLMFFLPRRGSRGLHVFSTVGAESFRGSRFIREKRINRSKSHAVSVTHLCVHKTKGESNERTDPTIYCKWNQGLAHE
jgi:hypothetical protein